MRTPDLPQTSRQTIYSTHNPGANVRVSRWPFLDCHTVGSRLRTYHLLTRTIERSIARPIDVCRKAVAGWGFGVTLRLCRGDGTAFRARGKDGRRSREAVLAITVVILCPAQFA